MAEKIKIALAAIIAAAGLFGFYALADKAMIARLGVLVGAFAAAAAVMWFTQAGRDFVVFARESWEEAKRVVWPSRKESLQTTGVVFAFVFVMAIFLWAVDAGLLWVTQRLLGQGG
jgi:preprotein translocase subunit SecE